MLSFVLRLQRADVGFGGWPSAASGFQVLFSDVGFRKAAETPIEP